LLETIVPEIYDAALDPEGWGRLLRRLREYFGAHAANLLTVGTDERFLWVADNIDPEFGGRLYFEHWIREDVWFHATLARGLSCAHSQVIGESLVDRRTLTGTPFFNEFLKPCNVQGLAGTVLFDERDSAVAPRTHLSFFGAVGQPEFEPQVLERVRLLVPHLRRALTIHWRLQKLHGESRVREQALDALPNAVFLLDRRGLIVSCNAKARELLQARGVISVQHGRIVALGVRSNPTLQEALIRADAGEGSSIAFLNSPSAGKEAWCARLAPLRETERFALTWPQASRMLIVESPANPEPDALVPFAELYGLTPAERQVLALLCEDHTPAEIASILQVGINTIRTHLQNLRHKTETRRQAELVRITLAATRKL